MTSEIEGLEKLLVARYSCRGFRPDPVPDEMIARLITAAGRAPSWCNAQPWQVVVTKGDATARFREALLAEVDRGTPQPDLVRPEGYPGVYGARRRECGMQLYEAVGVAREDRAARAEQSLENFRLFGAPHVAIVHSEAELGPYGAIDSGGFVTIFMLAAAALGLGSVAQASVVSYAPFIRTHFGLPETRLIVCAISFGWPDPDHPANSFRTTRAELGELLDLRG